MSALLLEFLTFIACGVMIMAALLANMATLFLFVRGVGRNKPSAHSGVSISGIKGDVEVGGDLAGRDKTHH